MSRTNGDPQTPRNKESSSSLLASFRNLTSSKPRTPSSTVTPSATPPVSSTSNPFDLPPGLTSQDHLDQDAAEALRTINDLHAPTTDQNLRATGPPGLRSLLGDLRPDKSISQRISAAKAITKLLAQYTGADVIQIWTVGRDLLELRDSRDAVVAAHELLNACVCHKSLEPVDTKLFFQSLETDPDPRVLSLRIKILINLTNNGRSIADLGRNFMSFLVRLLNSCYEAAKPSRKAKKTATSINNSLTEQEVNLSKVFDYILDVLRYNSKAFMETDLHLLIESLHPLAQSATAVSDLQKTADIIDTLTTYACLPLSSLALCMELLCGMYASVEELKGSAWRTVNHLLSSHLGPATINAIIHILKNPPDKRNTIRARGACALICTLLESPDVEDPPQTVMPKLVSACRQSLILSESGRFERLSLRLTLLLCKGDDPLALVFNDKIWANIEEIILYCAKRIQQKPAPANQGFLQLTDDRASSVSTRNSEAEALALEDIRRVAAALTHITDDIHSEHRLQAMRLLMRISDLMDDEQANVLIDYYAEACLLYTFHEEWTDDCRTLMNSIFKDHNRSTAVRRKALAALHDAHGTGEALGSPAADGLLLSMLECISPEPEPAVVEDLCQIAITAGTDCEDETKFVTIVESLKVALHEGVASGSTPTAPFGIASFAQRMGYHTEKPYDSLSTSIAKTLVRIFLRSVNVSSWKAKLLYEVMLAIARSSHYPAEARIIVLKLLFRLRAESNHCIFVVSNTESEDIAALLCRTVDTAVEHSRAVDSPVIRPSRPDEQIARRSNNSTAHAMAKPSSRSGAPSGRSPMNSTRLSRPTPPLWLYPGPKGLPEEPSPTASHLLVSKHDQMTSPSETDGRTVLRVGTWLELLLDILQQDELEWEVYSYALVHLGAQLANHALFIEAIPQIKMLRSVICGQLANKNFHEPPSFTGLKRSDAAICLYHVLTMLISYRKHFSRNEEDDIVRIFASGIVSWERTSEICIHALSVCCHELPGSLIKVLEGTLQRMSQIITQSQVAVHILEFLAALARLPELYRNFREEEFKIVFGICFRYLQDARDSRSKGTERNSSRFSNSQARPGSYAKDQVVGNSRPTSLAGSAITDDLPQYVYSLAYHVMTFWFMSLKLQDRSKHVGWISQNLLFTDSSGREVMEEQGQVTIDMMQRVAFSDRDETYSDPYFAKEQDGVRARKSWLVGKSIVTIETAGRTGYSQIIRRRPTGTTFATYRPMITKPPRHQAPITFGSTAESFYTEDYIGIRPEHVFQEFYTFQDYLSAPFSIELPEEEAVERALKSFDRIDPLDGHKVGIIYVGDGQTSESDILSNVMGSADYTAFVNRIGTLVELRDAPFNTQGLDRSETEMDGKFTIAWRDRVTEAVFHVTTMMPNHEHDTNRTSKKKHIGNDFVNIIFNNSGRSWDIDNIPSEFNHVNIVIAPEARASFVETRLNVSTLESTETSSKEDSRPTSPSIERKRDPYASLYYKVTMLTKPGIPAMSPAHTTKIISGASLPAFVRLLALNASSFAQVWINRESAGGSGEPPSSWRSRLKEIAKLRDRYGPPEAPTEPPRNNTSVSNPADTVISNNAAQGKTTSIHSTSSALSARDSAFFLRRASKPNIYANLGSMEAVDMERSSSAGSSSRT